MQRRPPHEFGVWLCLPEKSRARHVPWGQVFVALSPDPRLLLPNGLSSRVVPDGADGGASVLQAPGFERA